jgi:hypothetical protein
MISFRFHLVSLTAIFLALAIGVAMGATVVDRATVNLLENRLDNVKRNSDQTNKQNDQLRGELARWNQFVGQAGDRLVKGRLNGLPVVVVAVDGTDRPSLDALRQTLVSAGATLQGTLFLTGKLSLRDNGDLATLRRITDAASARPPDLRRIVASEVAAGLTSTAALAPLAALVENGFARVEAAGGATIGASGLATDGARYIVVSDSKATSPNPELAQPLVDELAHGRPARVLAAEAGRDAHGNDPAVRAQFVGPIRSESTVQVSTVDDLDQFAGRVAVVLALQGMGEGRVGHYGVGPGASALLPDLPQ